MEPPPPPNAHIVVTGSETTGDWLKMASLGVCACIPTESVAQSFRDPACKASYSVNSFIR